MGMEVTPREAGRVTYSAEIRAKKKICLTPRQKSVITGSIFGDGTLELNWSKTNYRLKIENSVKQKEYVWWKYDILQELVLREPRYNPTNRSISFKTISHKELTEFAQMFYQGRQKILPNSLEQFVNDPMVLAVWFMDDGNAIRRNGKVYGYHLNTHAYMYEENVRLVRTLLDVYSIDSLIERSGGRYRIRIMRENSRQNFRSVIQPYILESMRYKIG
jgi:hypothetical protein